MEQQSQQPIQQESNVNRDFQPPKKSLFVNKRLYFLIALVAVVVSVAGFVIWLGAYIDLFDTRGKLKEKIQRSFPIQEEKQTCIVDSDCAAVYADCTYCRCTAVNKQYESNYQRLYWCENYEGEVCDYDCFPKRQVAKCINNRCQLSAESPDEKVTSSWQTYRNDEFGFEVKYPFDTFVVAPVETAVYPDFEIKYKGEKLIYAGREKMLGKKECSYGEAGFAVVCNSASEDGISFIIADKDISYLKNAGSAGGEDEGEVTLGGRKGVKYSYGAEGYNTEHYYIHVQHKATPYAIYLPQTLVITIKSTFNWESSIRSPSKELVDQILSTFRFTL